MEVGEIGSLLGSNLIACGTQTPRLGSLWTLLWAGRNQTEKHGNTTPSPSELGREGVLEDEAWLPAWAQPESLDCLETLRTSFEGRGLEESPARSELGF